MNPMKRQITADTLRELPKSKVNELFEALGPRKVEELKHDWNFWARDNQLAPGAATPGNSICFNSPSWASDNSEES